jgi:TonB family protein
LGPNSTHPGKDRQEVFQPEPVARADAPAAANVIVLAKDATLLEIIEHSLDGRQKVWRANDALHAAELLIASQSGILFVDAALTRIETPTLVDKLHEQFPDVPIVVTGRRDDEIELGERISTGAVFRFVHKPVSTERVRNFIDAAVRRSGEQLGRTPSPTSDGPSVPTRALSSVRAIRLPHVEVDPARLKRGMRGAAWIVLAVLLGWGLVAVVQHRSWEPIPLPDLAGFLPAGHDEAAAARQDETLSRVLGAAGIALSQGRLVEPEGQNALELYRRVLRADPDNAEARAGLARTTEALLLRVEQDLLTEDLSGAAAALDAARSADPSNPRLEFFSSQLARAREGESTRALATATGGVAAERAQAERIARLLSQAERRMKDGKLVGGIDSAQAYVLEARQAAPEDAGVQQALNALSGRMLLAASEAMHEGDMVTAGGWLDRAESLGVDGKSVARLRAEIASAQLASVHEDRSRLLALANQRIAQGRLLEPAGDSARHYVDLLQAADPNFDGLAETESLLSARLLERARQQSANGRHAEAAALLAAAESTGARELDLTATGMVLADDRSQATNATAVVPEDSLVKIEHRAPDYPTRAAARGTQGWVDVQFTVAADGSTRDAVVTDSSPAGLFEKSVLDAIRDWRYEPRIVAGRPVDQRVELRVRFELKGN